MEIKEVFILADYSQQDTNQDPNQDLMESLFESIDTIVNKRIENLPYDKTIIAHIEDNSQASKGKYIVNDGTSSFEAYSENTTYTINENVYVNVPQGDFQKQKTITGKYIPDVNNAVSYNYVSPMESFVNITGNLIDVDQSTWQLISNGDSVHSTFVSDGKPDSILIWEAPVQISGFDTMGFSAEFRSWLSEYELTSGGYGIRIDLTCEESSLQAESQQVNYSFYLTESDMEGDSYNFDNFYLQEKIFDISELSQINYIRIYFYQDSQFKDLQGELINVFEGGEEGQSYYNLFINEPVLALGYNLSNFKEDKVILYTFDSKTYVDKITDEIKSQYPGNYDFTKESVINDFLTEFNSKILNLRWIHLLTEDEDSGIYNITQTGISAVKAVSIESIYDLPEGSVVKWYHYEVSENNTDNYDAAAGMFWVEIPEFRDQFEVEVHPDIYSAEEKWKVIIESPSRESIEIDIDDELNINGGLYAQKANLLNLIDYSSIDNNESKFLLSLLVDNGELLTSFQSALNLLDNSNLTISEQEYQMDAIIETKKIDFRNIYNSYPRFYNNYILLFCNRLNRTNYIDEISALITDLKNNFSTIIDNYYNQYGLTDIETQNLEILLEVKGLVDNINQEIEDYKTEMRGSVQYYASEPIVFLNENKTAELNTLQTLKNLTIECDVAGLLGRYNIYDQTGYIKNEAEAKKERILTAKYNTYQVGTSNLDNVDKIEWRIPLLNTMIQKPEEGVEYSLYDVTSLTVDVNNYSNGTFYIFDKTNQTYRLATAADTFDANETYYVKNDTTYIEQDGYAIITRFGIQQKSDNTVAEVEILNTSDQYFRIKPLYSNNLTNNTVYCSVYKNNTDIKIEAETTLTFGPAGNNGTDYTFYLEFKDKAIALTAGGFTADDVTNNKHKVTIVPKVFNYNGREITSEIDTFNWSWHSQSGENGIISENNGIEFTIWSSNPTSGTPNMYSFFNYVLKCQCSVDITFQNENILDSVLTNNGVQTTSQQRSEQKVTLTAYLPIPVRAYWPHSGKGEALYNHKVVYGYNGNSLISYDSTGTNPLYFKDKFQVQSWGNTPTTTGKIVPKIGVVWTTERKYQVVDTPAVTEAWIYNNTAYSNLEEAIAAGGVENDTITHRTAVPAVMRWEIDETTDEFCPHILPDGSLIVPSMYLNNFDSISIACKVDNEVIFVLPLYIYKRVYDSKLLNSWDGSLTLNKNDGIILSTMMGAGYKDDENRFTGVLMGDVSIADESPESSITEFRPFYSGTGLYGYNAGEKSFGLNINGKAFLGKAGRGQLLFDGDKGSIFSAAWYIDKTFLISGIGYYKKSPIYEGAFLDIDDGRFEINGSIGLFFPEKELELNCPLYRGENPTISNYPSISNAINYNGTVLTEQELNNNGIEVGQSQIILDSNPPNNQSPYFLIKTNKNKELMYVGVDDYYLQSADFNNIDPFSDRTIVQQLREGGIQKLSKLQYQQGTSINLANGEIISYNFKLRTQGCPPLGYGFTLENGEDGYFNFEITAMSSTSNIIQGYYNQQEQTEPYYYNHREWNYYGELADRLRYNYGNTEENIASLVERIKDQAKGFPILEIKSPSTVCLQQYKDISDTCYWRTEYNDSFLDQNTTAQWMGVFKFTSPNFEQYTLLNVDYYDNKLGRYISHLELTRIDDDSNTDFYITRYKGWRSEDINNNGEIEDNEYFPVYRTQIPNYEIIKGTQIDFISGEIKSHKTIFYDADLTKVSIKDATIYGCDIEACFIKDLEVEGAYISTFWLNEGYVDNSILNTATLYNAKVIGGSLETSKTWDVENDNHEVLYTYTVTAKLFDGLLEFNDDLGLSYDKGSVTYGIQSPSRINKKRQCGYFIHRLNDYTDNHEPYIGLSMMSEGETTLEIRGIKETRNFVINARQVCLTDIVNSSTPVFFRAYNDNFVEGVSLKAGISNAGLFSEDLYSEYTGETSWLIHINKSLSTITVGNTHCHLSSVDYSDRRGKTNINNLTINETLNILKNIDIVNFIYKNDENHLIHTGIIAQQLRDILINYNINYRPYLGIHKKDKRIYNLQEEENEVIYSVDYIKFVPLLWKGWQIHDNQINKLTNTINQLKQEIQELKEKNKNEN